MTCFLLALFVVFGLPLALVLLLRSDSRAGAKVRAALGLSEKQLWAYPSFSRWWSADRDRAEASREIARKHDLQYIGKSTVQMEGIQHFFLFRYKRPGVIEELLLRECDGMRESLFTHYESPRWRSTFAHFTSASLDLPEFRLVAHDFPLRDLTAAEIAFEGVPLFAAAYEVRGEDEAQIRALLDRRIRTALAGHDGFWIEGKRSELLCGKSTDFTQTEEREEFFRAARDICALFTGNDPDATPSPP